MTNSQTNEKEPHALPGWNPDGFENPELAPPPGTLVASRTFP